MSGIGSGRGRGWLKLEKNNGPQRPGVESNKFEPHRPAVESNKFEPHRPAVESNKFEPHRPAVESNKFEPHRPAVESNKFEPHRPAVESNKFEPRRAAVESNKFEPHRAVVESNKFEPTRTQIIPQEKNSYDELLSQIECLNISDDGILLNNKIKHIRDVFLEMCPTEDEIHKAVQAINRKCLREESFIEKLILLVTSAYFYNKQTTKEQIMWRDSVRKGFIDHLQENFENRELLRKTTPVMFYNSLKLVSSYFWNIKKVFPSGYPGLESQAVIGYLDTLLDFGDAFDIKMFAMMVCEKIGVLVKLFEAKDPKLLALLDKIKLAVVSDEKFPKKDKILLFFAWDLIRHKYQISPEDLAFYKNNLGEDDIKDILMKYNYLNKLDLECPEIKNGRKKDHISQEEDNCVNHSLKSSHRNFNLTASDIIPHNTSANNSSYDKSINTISQNSKDQSHASNFKDNFSMHNDSSEQIPQSIKSINLNETKDYGSKDIHTKHHNPVEKIGRPILGVGARLKKN